MELFIWDLAERFGWTLEYIDGLSVERMREIIALDDARAKAKAKWRKK